MKLLKIISAALSAVLVLSYAVTPVSAEGFVLSAHTTLYGSRISVAEFSNVTADKVMSVDDAAQYMRECLEKRTYEFSVTIPFTGFSNEEDAVVGMLAKSLEETSKGIDGDYIRFAMKGYKYGTLVDRKNVTLLYRMQYYTSLQEEQQTDEKVAEMMASLGLRGRTEYETIRAVYDCVSDIVNYAEVDENEEPTDLSIFSAYGAAVKGCAVCQGYAQLLYRMLKEAGISSRIIAGTSMGIRHTWNIARAGGKYYLLDVTWDSMLGGSDGAYFMKGSEDFDDFASEAAHIPIYEHERIFPDYESDEFKAEYPISAVMISAPNYTTGDVDGNNVIDGIDASAVLTAYAIASAGGIYPFTPEQSSAADVTGDGITDANDASCILSYYAASSAGKADDIITFIKNRT